MSVCPTPTPTPSPISLSLSRSLNDELAVALKRRLLIVFFFIHFFLSFTDLWNQLVTDEDECEVPAETFHFLLLPAAFIGLCVCVCVCVRVCAF